MDAVAGVAAVGERDRGRSIVLVSFLGASEADGARDGKVSVRGIVHSEGNIHVLSENALGAVVLATGGSSRCKCSKRGEKKCGDFHFCF